MAQKPLMVTYYNANTLALSTLTSTPYTDVILAFALPENSQSTTLALSGNLPSASDLKSDIQVLQQAGIMVHLSFGGEVGLDGNPINYTLLSQNVSSIADQLAAFVTEFNLDGIDIDYEDTNALMNATPYNGVTFATDLTNDLRQAIGADKIISHAPQPPYLWQDTADAPYAQILTNTGDAIDRIYMQYYNNPWYVTPVSQIIDNYNAIVAGWSGFSGIAASRLLVGKPVAESDAGSGWIPATDIGTQIITPLLAAHSDFGGVMGWQYSSGGPNSPWVTTLPGYLWS